MVRAFNEAVTEFAENGIAYDIVNGQTEPDGTYHATIFASGQEMLALGIKTGYKLKK